MDKRVEEAIAAVNPEKMDRVRSSFDDMLADYETKLGCCEHRCSLCPRTYTHHIRGDCDEEDYICGGCLLLGESGVDPRRIP